MTKTPMITPFGRAGYSNLIRPSFKFQKQRGEFSVQLILSPEEAAPLIETLDALYEDAYAQNLAEIQKDKPKIAEIKRADKPYRNLQDPDTGETLEDIRFSFRLKFRRIGKDENGVERVFGENRPKYEDAKKQPMRQFVPKPFYTAALGSGLSLLLVGVQVKDFVAIGEVDTGFDEIEDGYIESAGTTASDPVEVTHAPAEPVVTGGAEISDEEAEW